MLRNGLLTLRELKIPWDFAFEYERLVDILFYLESQKVQEKSLQSNCIYLLKSLAPQLDKYQRVKLGNLGVINVTNLKQQRLKLD